MLFSEREVPIVDAKRENQDHGLGRGPRGGDRSTLLNQFINKTMTESDPFHELDGKKCRDPKSKSIGACFKTREMKTSGNIFQVVKKKSSYRTKKGSQKRRVLTVEVFLVEKVES